MATPDKKIESKEPVPAPAADSKDNKQAKAAKNKPEKELTPEEIKEARAKKAADRAAKVAKAAEKKKKQEEDEEKKKAGGAAPSPSNATAAAAPSPTDAAANKKNKLRVKPKSETETKQEPVDEKREARRQSAIFATLAAPVLPLPGQRNILITSALPYVNNVPHLGNIIGCVLSADVYARFCRLRGYNTLYVCGTDEYGTATETKALQEKCTEQQLCDRYHAIHRDIYQWFGIAFDKFGRTTTPHQTQIAQDIFWACDKNNLILEQKVSQQFCTNCQRFLADRYIEGTCPHKDCAYTDARGDQCDKCGRLLNATDLVNPRCKVCSSAPIPRDSNHLFLNLPEISKDLTSWVNSASVKGAWTDNSIQVTQSWLRTGLQPRCISRDLRWGTPVPKQGFTDKVFYVWFDAPIGYLSITANYTDQWKKWWENPEQVQLYQFMGKDNIPFHTVIFPCTLIGTKRPYTMLHHISTTEYLNYENGKFSKSRSTGVFGDDAKTTGIPADVWRYYLLSVRPETSDAVFAWEDFANRNNSELLANLGNLVNRSLSITKASCNGVVPDVKLDATHAATQEFIAKINTLLGDYIRDLEAVKLRSGLATAMRISTEGNAYFQSLKPWELLNPKNKTPEKAASDRIIGEYSLVVVLSLVRLLAIVFQPYMPDVSFQIQEQLNVQLSLKCLAGSPQFQIGDAVFPKGHAIGTPKPIFRKIEDLERDQLKARFAGKQDEKDAKAPAAAAPAAKGKDKKKPSGKKDEKKDDKKAASVGTPSAGPAANTAASK